MHLPGQISHLKHSTEAAQKTAKLCFPPEAKAIDAPIAIALLEASTLTDKLEDYSNVVPDKYYVINDTVVKFVIRNEANRTDHMYAEAFSPYTSWFHALEVVKYLKESYKKKNQDIHFSLETIFSKDEWLVIVKEKDKVSAESHKSPSAAIALALHKHLCK